MNYCKRHDLAFCENHPGPCLSVDCKIVDDPRVDLCSVCIGIYKPSVSFLPDFVEVNPLKGILSEDFKSSN